MWISFDIIDQNTQLEGAVDFVRSQLASVASKKLQSRDAGDVVYSCTSSVALSSLNRNN